MIEGTRFFIKKTREKGVKVILKHLFLSPLLEILFKALPYSPLRIFFLNMLGAKIRYNALVYNISLMNYDIGSLRNLRVGRYAYLQPGVMIDLCDKIDIDDHAGIGAGSIILTHSKAGNLLDEVFPPKKMHIKIGKNCFIGANTVIMANIGDQAVIGPGSVVNKDIPPNCIAMGVPAKIVRKIQ